MNILPKKSWHVRNKDNIDRVRRDEENVRLEEEKLAKRAALAEQEARTKLLRDRAHVDKPSSTDPSSSVLPYGEHQIKHVNLFEDEESGNASLKGTNIEYEAEKKAEQEKKEKAIGILKYLGQSTVEGESPWYLTRKSSKETEDTCISKKESSKDIDKKNRLDPLGKMNSFLADTKKSNEKEKKHKKEKKHRKEEHKKGKKTILELRYERMQREKQGSLRAEKLIQDLKKGTDGKAAEDEDPFNGRYHSQYNPDLARKPKWSSRYQPY